MNGLIKNSAAKSKALALSFLTLSLIGLTDASYLTIEHYRGLSVGCIITNGCDKVTSSIYSTVGPLPVSLLGAAYYLIIFGCAAAYLLLMAKSKNEPLTRSIFDFMIRFTAVGFLASLWFVYLQLFVIGAVCSYCMASALISTILFVLGAITFYKRKQAAVSGKYAAEPSGL